MLNNLLREPLLHFLIIGVLLFGFYELASDDEHAAFTNTINISASDIEQLREQWRLQNGGAADEETLDELIKSRIQEEVLFREARRLGLDENDSIIRRRMIQKMRFLSANMAQLETPDDAALMEYFEQNKARYRVPEKRSFRHIYFNNERHGEALQARVKAVLQELTAAQNAQSIAQYGDNFILPSSYTDRQEQRVAQLFGADFAAALFALDPNTWSGPLQSAYGSHLVRIDNISASYLPAFSNIKEKLLADLMNRQLGELKEKSYQAMRERYEVNIEDE